MRGVVTFRGKRTETAGGDVRNLQRTSPRRAGETAARPADGLSSGFDSHLPCSSFRTTENRLVKEWA